MGAHLPNVATLKSLQAERDLLSSHVDALHDEMMRLPLHKRKDRWEEYYRRLDGLTRYQQKLEKAIEALHAQPK